MATDIGEELRELWRDENRALILFPITVLFTAPLFHEIFHITFLELYRCPYDVGLYFSMAEIFVEVQPGCQLTTAGSLLVLGAGLIGTTVMGVLIFFVGSVQRLRARTEEAYLNAFYWSVIALGFFFSTSFYFFLDRGDIVNMLATLDLQVAPVYRYAVGFVIMTLTVARFWIGFRAAEQQYREDVVLARAKERSETVWNAFRSHLKERHVVQVGRDQVADEEGEDRQ